MVEESHSEKSRPFSQAPLLFVPQMWHSKVTKASAEISKEIAFISTTMAAQMKLTPLPAAAGVTVRMRVPPCSSQVCCITLAKTFEQHAWELSFLTMSSGADSLSDCASTCGLTSLLLLHHAMCMLCHSTTSFFVKAADTVVANSGTMVPSGILEL